MTRKSATFLIVVVLLACLAAAVRSVSLRDLVAMEQQLRGAIAAHRVAALPVGFLVYLLVSLVPGTSGKSVVFGWMFGFWPALIIVESALTCAAMLSFWFSRYVFRDAIQSRFGAHLVRVNRALAREGPVYLLTLRLVHAPFTFVNYLLGVSPVGSGTFCWTTLLGLLPGTVVFVYIGTRLPTLAQWADSGAATLLDPCLLAALVLPALFPAAVRLLVRRLQWPNRGRYDVGGAAAADPEGRCLKHPQ